MTANINPKTGIAYGVVSLHSLEDWVWDDFLDNGVNETMRAAEQEWRSENPHMSLVPQEWYDEYESDGDEYSLESEGMKLGLGYLGGSGLVWVFESPHVTEAPVCSPCVPGAGDLDSAGRESLRTVRCYTLPPDWFIEGEIAHA